VSELLFVYGTLRRGEGNHQRYLAGATYLGEFVMPKAKLMTREVPGIKAILPFMVHFSHGGVVGEIYRVTSQQLENIDTLEGHPSEYHRSRGKIPREWQNPIIPWAYWWPWGTVGMELVKGGDWKKRGKV
jgi:gamma-glutamylcyclotransferase (GGCT)/AIG2-like uncharacterized protein YtfP